MKKLHVIGPREKTPEGAVFVNTTSRSKDFGKAFSPFMNQGPIELGGLVAHNVENLWQFTKVYPKHTGDREWWEEWRDQGLADERAHRYPMGKGAKPVCAVLNNKRLDYIKARKKIYIPAYRQKLERYCMREVHSLMDMLTVTDVALWDFDGYTTDKSFKECVEDPSRSLGHAFVVRQFVEELLNAS